MQKFSNELINERSLYLLKHAYNPVNWKPWNDKTLKQAKKENKIIILSIGYSTCHWCHVMERESFQDKKVADFMNKHFISIKVDREERPDIDIIYMDAIQKMGIQGGWPLNIFLLPNQKPFYGGTYFTIDNWFRILENIKNISKDNMKNVIESSEKFTKEIINTNENFQTSERYNIQTLINEIKLKFDFDDGGMLREPKFPMPSLWNSLLLHSKKNNDKELYNHVLKTINSILSGGVYDHLGGGISRYSIDKKWEIPHFEKMLYDNGLFIELLSNIYRITKNDKYKYYIDHCMKWMLNEMISKEGGFYSAIDAESENIEGKFYRWKLSELKKIFKNENQYLPKEINLENNFGEFIILTLNKNIDFLSEKIKIKLFNERNKRIKPIIDKKIICSWNSIALIGIVNAYQATKNNSYLEIANKNAIFIKTKLLNNDKLYRIYGTKKLGYLDDYAHTIKAFILYYETTKNKEFLVSAKELIEFTISKFYNRKEKMFNYSSSEHEKLISNKIEIFDNVIPSSNSVMYNNLLFMGKLFDDILFKNIFNEMGDSLFKYLNTYEFMHNWIYVNQINLYKVNEIKVNESINKNDLLSIQTIYSPNKVILFNEETEDKQSFILCRNNVCEKPIFKIEKLLSAIKI
ncbi:MAG: thioredoxin domain-containing protein [Flammeovirgaceae bacterium TMED290]|nr:MAG: thioredoxin domain-containing protein [Flammeovirgaceae bacterium TMED290]